MFFFTDLADLGPEPYNGNFGRKSDSEFQVSSQFQSASTSINPRAYAVCSGRIAFVFAHNYNDNYFDKLMLTIVLKPDSQPGGNIPYVKYYLYKGIIASSILSEQKVDPANGNHRHLLNLNNAVSIPFLQRIQDDYTANTINNPGTTIRLPDEDLLGMQRTNGFGAGSTNLDSILDNIFNNNWGDGTPPLPKVDEGELIGYFIPKGFDVGTSGRDGQFCFEIILDRVGKNAHFAEASGNSSGSSNKFGNNFRVISTDVSSNGGLETAIDQPTFNATVKSEILRFMDPCAFYGSFANLGMTQLTVVTNGIQSVLNLPGLDQISVANNIYNGLLNSPGYSSDLQPITGSNIFKNRNTIYIDIRDKYNNPYDFTRDKTIELLSPPANLRIGFNSIPLLYKSIDYLGEETGPFSQSRGWPILTIEKDNDFDAGVNPIPSMENLRGFPKNINNNLGYNTIDISFPNPAKNISSSCLFINNIEFVSPQDANNTNDEGILHIDDTQSTWSTTFHLRSPNSNTNTSDAIPISNYISIIHIHCYLDFYEGEIANVHAHPIEIDPYNSNQNNDFPQPMEKHPQNYCDFLWPIDLTLNWSGWNEDRIRSTVYSDNIPVDNMGVTGSTFIGNLGIARDADAIPDSPPGFKPKVTLFAYNTIPLSNSMGLIDREFDESDDKVFRFTGDSSYLSNIGSNITEFSYDLKKLSIETGDIYIDHLVKRTRAQIAALGLPSSLLTVNDFVYFTINKVEYDAILNNWKSFLYDNSNVEKPIKAWWSFEPIKSEWDPVAEREFIRFQINIKYLNRGGTANPAIMKVYTPVNDNGSPYFSLKFMDKVDITSLTPTLLGRGYSIENYQGIDRIQCTINFVKGVNLSYDEFLTYKNYALKNIRQIWSNPEGQPTDPTGQGLPSSDYSNLGLTARVRSGIASGQPVRSQPITAWDITAQQGCSCSLSKINPGEIVILVERSLFAKENDYTAMKRDRPFVFGSPTDILDVANNVIGQRYTARLARFVYNATPGTFNTTTAPYQDDNHAAHEFGHFLGLTDRYTYAANVDSANQIIDNTGVGINLYLPLTLDPDYGEDYRWIMNIMSGGSRKVPALPLPIQYSAMHPEFRLAISGFESPNNNQYSTGSRGNTFITPFQWNIVRAFAMDSQNFENNRFLRPEYNLQEYVHFAPSGTNWNFNLGTFAGFSPDLGRSVSDHSFIDSFGSHKMLDRINDMNTNPTGDGIPSIIIGYFSPFDPQSGDPFMTNTSANIASEMLHIRLGEDVDIIFSQAISSALQGISLPSFGNPSSNVRFNGVGTTDGLNVGRNIWNTILDRVVTSSNPSPKPPAANETINYPNTRGVVYSHTFLIQAEYRNRMKIIQLLVNGNC